MKKIFFFLAALMLSFTAQAAVVNAHPNGGEAGVLSWFLSQTNAGDTLLLADGEYIQPSSMTFDKEGLVVKAAEGAKPVIALTDEGGWTTMKVDASTIFDGITFDGKGVAKYPVYINGTAVKKATFVNCEFKNYAKYAISDPYGGGTHVDSLIVNNCYFHDGGEAVYISKYGLEGQHGCNYCEITNSTLYNLTTSDYAGMIHVSSCNEATGAQNEVVIDHVTLYNYTGSSLGGIAIRKSSNLKISNSIIANPSDTTGFYAFYIYGGTIDNTLYYNTNDDADATHTACLTVDPMFVDAANGNLALAEGSPAIGAATDGSNLGDPRWNATEEPEEKLPAASVRAWAYDLALAVEGEQYTFSYKATTAAKASLIFTDADGVELAIVDLGVVEAGANSKVLAASELPAGKKVNWAVKLEAGAVENLVEVTDQSRGIYDFYNMMDVLVDNNPESEYFGKIYIQMAYNGGSDGMTTRSQTQTAGVFIYDQELNELNDPSNVGIKPTLPEGYTMGDNRNKFHRLEIDPKTGNLTYCYNVAGQPAIFSIDRANMTGEVTNLLAGVEGITRTSAHCFDEDGTLYVYDLPGAGIIHKVVDGVASVLAASDAKWVQVSATMATDGRGGLWVAQNRGQIDTYYQLAHYTAEGTIDFAVYQGSENGFSGSSTRGALVYDAERQLLAQGRNGAVEVYSVAYDAETGVPTLTLVATTPSVGTNIDGLAFDYAGDLYVVNSSKEKFQKFAMPTANNVCTTPAASKYGFEIVEPVEIVGVVKRAIQNGDAVIVLTHEEDGTAHIYNVVDGVAVSEISQEGVVARNPENLGDYLAISDIAITEDGKLVANNYMRVTNLNYTPDAGYERGQNRFYIWNDLAGAPEVWFTSQMTSNSIRSDQGITMAVKGTSANAKVLTTGVHNSGRGVRMSLFKIIDGKFVDPNGGAGNKSEYYWYISSNFKSDAVYNEAANGVLPQLNASPLGDSNWVMDNIGMTPSEFSEPADGGGDPIVIGEIAADVLGVKYNGASYVTVGEKVLMVAPYANAEGLLAGVQVLDITNGFADAQYVDLVTPFDAPIAATAAATAVMVVENGLEVTLVADNTIYMTHVGLELGPDYMVIEDEITNLMIDLDNLILIGGPSTNYSIDVFLGLAEDNGDGTFTLSPESSIAVQGSDATFIEGYAYEIDAYAPAAKAVVRAEFGGQYYEFQLTMSAAPMEPTVIVVENANVELEEIPLFGDTYDYALKMTGNWTDANNVTYPVLVEIPVYYPNATEPFEILSTVTVGGWGDNDPWLGFGEGTLTVSTENDVVTAKGIVENPMAGVAFDITISGKLIISALENIDTTVAPAKVIKNGQLIITKDGVEYNAQGAVIK